MAGWHQTYEKFEFASPEWVDMLRGLITEGLDGKDLRGIEFTLTGEPISFPAVACQANVSVSLLYGHAELAGRISDVRNRQRQAGVERAWRLPGPLARHRAEPASRSRQHPRTSPPARPRSGDPTR